MTGLKPGGTLLAVIAKNHIFIECQCGHTISRKSLFVDRQLWNTI